MPQARLVSGPLDLFLSEKYHSLNPFTTIHETIVSACQLYLTRQSTQAIIKTLLED